jgi:beta-phosphoglucomutase
LIKAVIFDFDGVVGDTMNDNFIAWEKAFLFYQIEVTPLDYFLLEGMTRFQIAYELMKQHQMLDININELVDRKEQYFAKYNKYKLYPEIIDILILLKENDVNMGLVTGASKNRIQNTVDKSLLDYFSIIITADDVDKGKPDPEPYVRAIHALKLDASQCLVIENAQLGIQSAKKAGCKCFAIATTLPAQYLDGADEIFSSHDELLFRIQTMVTNKLLIKD